MSFKRSHRVAGLIRKIVGETLMLKVKNPQARKATVHSVDVSENLRHVKIYVSAVVEEKEETMKALDQVAGFIRKEIGAQAKLRFTPDIEFVYDRSLDNAERIEQLLKSVNSGR